MCISNVESVYGKEVIEPNGYCLYRSNCSKNLYYNGVMSKLAVSE